MTLLVLGPKTFLARTFMAQWSRPKDLFLMARDEVERSYLQSCWPHATVLVPDTTIPASAAPPLLVLVCALGPIHRSASCGEDVLRLTADVQRLRHCLDTWPGEEVHVLFVSSVLALAPRVESYGACKLLAEALLSEQLRTHRRATLSVLYPGRLVERRDPRRPITLLASRYDALAARITAWAHRPRSFRGIIGMDAWMLLRFAAFRQMLIGTPSVTLPRDADTRPAAKHAELPKPQHRTIG